MRHKNLIELAKNNGGTYSSHHTDKQPGDAGAGLLPDSIGRLDVLGNTRGQLIVAFRLFTHFVHDVIDGNLSDQPSDAIDHRHSHQIVFLNHLHDLVNRRIYMTRDKVLVHDVLHLGNAGAGYHFLQREEALQTFLVINDIDVVDVVHILSLLTHLAQAFGHRPVFVDDNHFRTHDTAGGILVVLEKVYNIAGLLDILNMSEHFLLLLLVEVTDNLNSIIGVHRIDELAGDGLRG